MDELRDAHSSARRSIARVPRGPPRRRGSRLSRVAQTSGGRSETLPRRADAARRRDRRARRAARPRACGHRRPAVLRLRDRRIARRRARAADMLATGWDQMRVQRGAVAGRGRGSRTSPAAGSRSSSASRATASVGFATGGQGANTVGLAAARGIRARPSRLGRRARRAAPARRASGSSRARSATRRSTGRCGCSASATDALEPVAGRRQRRDGHRRARRGARAGRRRGRRSSALQAGNVNTGACDDLAHGRRAARATRRVGARRRRVRPVGRGQPGARGTSSTGIELADSWAVRRAQVAQRARTTPASCSARDPRRARGRDGVHAPRTSPAGRARARRRRLRRPSRRAARAASRRGRRCASSGRDGRRRARRPLLRAGASASPPRLAELDGVEIVNDVVLNQVLVGFGDADAHRRGSIAAVQADGTCWMGGTTWRGRRATCASRCRTGRRPRPTSTARSRRRSAVSVGSWPQRQPDARWREGESSRSTLLDQVLVQFEAAVGGSRSRSGGTSFDAVGRAAVATISSSRAWRSSRSSLRLGEALSGRLLRRGRRSGACSRGHSSAA